MPHFSWLWLTALVCGCQNGMFKDPQTNDAVVQNVDGDGDGFTEDVDCDDTNADINSNAEELCDGIDNNCDGEVDEDVKQLFYADGDGDGYGETSYSVESCEAPEGYADNDLDCDDQNDAVYPDAPEQCDELDNDCDEVVDEELTEVWYLDFDEDGFGDPEIAVETCLPEANYVGNAQDCDDRDASVNPDAVESCDYVDNNCDGTVDEDTAVDVQTWYADNDNDGFGDATATWVECFAPTGYVSDSSDCDDTVSHVNPNAQEVCDGLDNDCDGSLPSTEVDDDGDGYVECSPSEGPGWQGALIIDGGDCDDDNSEYHDIQTWYLDLDGDGFGNPLVPINTCVPPVSALLDNTDCLDSDDTVFPSAPELCDGQINGCNGSLPSDETDLDGDGYVECIIDSGGWDGALMSGGNDCDDSNDSIAPNLSESCDGLDNNCDGTLPSNEVDDDGDGYVECGIALSGWQGDPIDGGNDCDDADPQYHQMRNWYLDLDEDGFGDDSSAIFSCSPQAGYIEDNTDCDDTDDTALSSVNDVDCDGTPSPDDCDDTDPLLNDLDLDLDGTSTCEYDCDDTDPGLTGFQGGGCPMGSSCLDILGTEYDVGDQVYTIDPTGGGPSTSYNVYCDMTTDGGGWTALVNPMNVPGISPLHPNVGLSGMHLPQGITLIGLLRPNCFQGMVDIDVASGNGWYAVQGFLCSIAGGQSYAQFNQSWFNDIGATDVMFTAALQGSQMHTLSINGTNITYDVYSNCAFWNGAGAAVSPGVNQCYSTMLNVEPHIYNDQFSGNLNIEVVTGFSCYPNCQYGVGYNMQKLFVR